MHFLADWYTFMLQVLTNLKPRETKIPASVCVAKGITQRMSHECSITNDPTHTTAAEPSCKAESAADLPQMPRTSHQYSLQLMISDRLSNLAPTFLLRSLCGDSKKNLFPAPCVTGPTHVLSLASAPVPWDPTAPGNHRTADFTSKSWSCGRGSHYMSECMQINVKHTEWGNFCNLNNVAMCLLAFSLME